MLNWLWCMFHPRPKMPKVTPSEIREIQYDRIVRHHEDQLALLRAKMKLAKIRAKEIEHDDDDHPGSMAVGNSP